ncbi:nitrate reductase cytochrome c-type subunit [Azospirillum doebereinerae]|uniref:Periplasmic nitrate reductase, electron transfer subunit n=1 Tax=Azospirillum doebereinerae TaxID=92933 RepID=A0A3S0X2D4_9PROT|nr:nitrate reductase cytochrome c-type subunit [Azospirillum doebereinerae]MCG5240177.1 nitrate reductase cytochrome c-type subunit [Azospirillum doebereinerae]RUQ75914.1 nitrate reductase cytochrome c-type subunit [Azospirillum doebereinerae]
MKTRFLIAALAFLAAAPALVTGVIAADGPPPASGPAYQGPKVSSGPHPITLDVQAESTTREIVDDVKRVRNYADQPPLIPHAIRDYQIDLNINKCLTCHDRRNVEGSQAPMVSVTHFQDRDGQTLGTVSARRYFCTQCHVPQTDAKPIVGNSFRDFDAVLGTAGKEGGH